MVAVNSVLEHILSQTRDALREGTIIIVGGDRRDAALRRLHIAFELANVIHCCTRKSDSSCRRFASQLHDPGVVLVVWVLGLSRTHHGEHLHRLCRTIGVPWVDCFRIPHPNALLARIADLRLLDSLHARRARCLLTLRRAQSGGEA
jgi:hypothetical protein